MKWIKEAQGLGQLYVSALTARRFFDWICMDYDVDEAPIVSCRLLLSPTDEERTADPAISTHELTPTLANCKAAITACIRDINALPEAARERSRLIFFFSGHGLQSTIDRQILLPSDFLGDGLPSFNHALSTKNLLNGLNSIRVPYRYYFLDACRNDTNEIRQVQPKGDEFLPEYPTYHSYPKIEVDALLYATTAAQRAWQPRHPSEGPTLFGQALLEGLRGRPHIRLEDEGGKPSVKFFNLESYMNGRIAELLKSHQSTADQRVQPGGLPRPRVVTQLRAPYPATAPQVPMPPMTAPEISPDLLKSLGSKTTGDADRLGMRWRKAPDDLFKTHDAKQWPRENTAQERASTAPGQPAPGRPVYDLPAINRLVLPDRQAGEWRQDKALGRFLFGSSDAATLFAGSLQVSALSGQRLRRDDGMRLLNVGRKHLPGAGGDPDQTRYDITFALARFDAAGYWLQLFDESGTGAGALLATDETMFDGGQATYALTVDLTHDADGLTIGALSAAPLASGDSPVAQATRLWQRAQSESAERAVSKFATSSLNRLLQAGEQSPLATVITALVLLRADRLTLLGDLLRDLPGPSDGAVLWAEQVMRQHKDPKQAAQVAAGSLARLARRDLPVTGEALSLAATLMDRLSLDLEILDDATRRDFRTAKARIDASLAYFRPGGLFTAFAGFTAQNAWQVADGKLPGRGAKAAPPIPAEGRTEEQE
ncbi:caspase family protein [Tropicibacter oceani]